jgi:pimeloyl-ACP methyl ester carboxylesterase
VPTLIAVGDHDQIDPSIAKGMAARIAGSRLVILRKSGHIAFVDQPSMFITMRDDFVHGKS